MIPYIYLLLSTKNYRVINNGQFPSRFEEAPYHLPSNRYDAVSGFYVSRENVRAKFYWLEYH